MFFTFGAFGGEGWGVWLSHQCSPDIKGRPCMRTRLHGRRDGGKAFLDEN